MELKYFKDKQTGHVRVIDTSNKYLLRAIKRTKIITILTDVDGKDIGTHYGDLRYSEVQETEAWETIDAQQEEWDANKDHLLMLAKKVSDLRPAHVKKKAKKAVGGKKAPVAKKPTKAEQAKIAAAEKAAEEAKADEIKKAAEDANQGE